MIDGTSQLSIPFDRSRCKCSENVHRSSRRGFRDFLQRLLGRYPYRCWDCGRRFHRFVRR